MHVVRMQMQHLHRRDRYVKAILNPLVERKQTATTPHYRRQIFVQSRSASSTYSIGVNEGRPPTSDYRDWRFGTIWSVFRANYYERWQLDDEGNNWWFLDRAYLHIYVRDADTGDEEEYLALHCDPNEPAGEVHVDYKKVPHLHIGSMNLRDSRSPWQHAHLALSRRDLHSIPSLSLVMGWAVDMLSKEVLQVYGNSFAN